MVSHTSLFRAIYISTLITVGVQSSLGAAVFRSVPLKKCAKTENKSAKELYLECKIDKLHAIMNTGNYPECARYLTHIRDFIKRSWGVSIDMHKVIDKCFQVIHEANIARREKRKQMLKQQEELEKRFGYHGGYTDPYAHLHEIENILEGVDVDGITESMHRVLDREEEFLEHEQNYRRECKENNLKFDVNEYKNRFFRDYGTSQEDVDAEIKREMNMPKELELVVIFGCAASFLSFVVPILPEVLFLSNLMYTFAGSAAVMLITYLNNPKKDEK